MNLGELRAEFREDAVDLRQPYLWSDRQLDRFANEAEEEACRRAHLIVDSSSSACLFKSSGALVKLDAKIIDVRRILLDGQSIPLSPISVIDLDRCFHGWDAETGEPKCYITDYQSGSIRLYPSPSSEVTGRMTVVRLPAKRMVQDSDQPEIRADYHRSLVHWMMHRAYLVQDADSFDPARAARSLAAFVAEFGESRGARNEHWMRETDNAFPEPLV